MQKLHTVKLPRAVVAFVMVLAVLLGTVTSGLAGLRTEAATEYVYVLVTTPTSGKKYLIVNENSNTSSAYMLTSSGGTSTVTVNSKSSEYGNYYIKTTSDTNAFTFSGSTSGFNLINSSGQYIQKTTGSQAAPKLGTSTNAAKFSYSSSKITITNPSSSSYKYLREKSNKIVFYSSNKELYFYEQTEVKSPSSITLNKSSLSLNTNSTGTVTATCSGCTVSSVTSSNSTIATVTYSGNTITVTGKSPGTATITVNGTGSSGYSNPTSQTFTVTVTGTVYGQIVYNANGGTGAPANSNVESTTTSSSSGATVNIKVSSDEPTRDKYTFLGWATTSNATSATYTGGSSCPVTAKSTSSSSPTQQILYAVWESNTQITNPSTATGNSLSLSKILTYDESTDSYTLTLKGWANSGAYTYTVDGYNKTYSYSTLNTGNYYYLYNGTYYQVKGLEYYSNDKGKNYYCGYFVVNGTTYYLDKTPQAYTASQLDKEHPGDNDSSKAYESCKQSNLSDGEELPLYTRSGTGMSYGTSSVLKDVINTTDFDISGVNVTSSSGTVSRNGGTITVTGYDYTGNYGGTPLTVTISGLKLKTYNETVPSNNGNAGIYASSSSSTPLVSITSPTVYDKKENSTPTFTVKWMSQDGNTTLETDSNVTKGTQPDYKGSTPTKSATAQYTYTFAGWSTSKNAESGTAESNLPAVSGDTTYYAAFSKTLNRYTVRWVSDNGNVLETDNNVSYGSTPSYDGATPTKEGYTFVGWEDANGNLVTTFPQVEGNTTYKARFSKQKSYSIEVSDIIVNTTNGTITFKSPSGEHNYSGNFTNGSDLAGDESGYYGSVAAKKYLRPSIRVFDEDHNEILIHHKAQSSDDENCTTGDLVSTYSFTLADDDSNTVKKYLDTDYLELISGKTGSTQVILSFKCYIDGVETVLIQPFNVIVNPCTITWNVDGNETATSANVGDSPVSGLTPTKSGYTFKGWATEPNGTPVAETNLPSVTGNTTYYAVFEKNATTYTMTVADVVYNRTTDTITMVDISGGTTGTAFTLEDAFCAGFIPSFRIDDSDGNNVTPTNPINRSYQYEFVSGDNLIDFIDIDAVILNDSKTGEAVLKLTYTGTFDGGEHSVSTTFNVKIIDDLYTITWVNDDGTVLETDKNVAAGTTPTYNGATPTKASTAQYDYYFIGWSPEVSPVTGNITYTANYTPVTRKYTVTWKDDDGTVLETDTNVPYGATPSYDGATPTKASTAQYTYTFAGWTPEVNPVTGNVTYTANYTPTLNNYTVIWKNYDGSVLKTDTDIPYGTTPSYTGTTPTKPSSGTISYTFKGWTPTVSAVTGHTEYTAVFEEHDDNEEPATKVPAGTYVNSSIAVPNGSSPYYPDVVITVDENGKISAISVTASNASDADQTNVSAVNDAAQQLIGWYASEANLDRLSSAYPGIDTSVKEAAKLALFGDGSVKNPASEGIQNPDPVTGNGVTLSKVLSKDGDSYTLTLTATPESTSGESVTYEAMPLDLIVVVDRSTEMNESLDADTVNRTTSTVTLYNTDAGTYSHSTLVNGTYYYQVSSTRTYPLQDINGYTGFIDYNGTTYYLTSSGGTTTSTSSATTGSITLASSNNVKTSTKPAGSGTTITRATGTVTYSQIQSSDYYYDSAGQYKWIAGAKSVQWNSNKQQTKYVVYCTVGNTTYYLKHDGTADTGPSTWNTGKGDYLFGDSDSEAISQSANLTSSSPVYIKSSGSSATGTNTTVYTVTTTPGTSNLTALNNNLQTLITNSRRTNSATLGDKLYVYGFESSASTLVNGANLATATAPTITASSSTTSNAQAGLNAALTQAQTSISNGRQPVVVFITDRAPGDSAAATTFNDTSANSALSSSKSIKDATSQAYSDNNTKVYTLLLNKDASTTSYSTSGTYAQKLNAFMHLASTNNPNGTSMSSSVSTGNYYTAANSSTAVGTGLSSIAQNIKAMNPQKETRTPTSQANTTFTNAAVLTDYLNTTNFDVSEAQVSSNKGTARLNNGTLTVSGYDYQTDYATPLTVTITGLKLQLNGPYQSSNVGYATITESGKETVQIVSPFVSTEEDDFIPETDASTDKKVLPTVTLLAVLATIATSAVLAADPRRRRREEE